MTEVVFSAPDYETIVAVAQQLGWFDEAAQSIRTNGILAEGGAWQLALQGEVEIVPAVYDNSAFPPLLVTPTTLAPGYWGRLRLNGKSDFLLTLPPDVFTIYYYDSALGGWTNDGQTLAPTWVATVAMIA